MRRRVVILTELIAPYRIPVFNALAKRGDVDLHVVFLSRTDLSMRQWRIYEDEIRFSYEVLPCWRKRLGKFNVLLNRGLPAALGRFSPEVIICGGYNYISSWQAQRWAYQHRVPFILWSESTGNDRRGMHLPMEFLKARFVEHCDGFVVPGQSAREYLLTLGVKPESIFAAPNAVDTVLFASAEATVRQHQSHLRASLVLPDRYFLFVGRLVEAKGVRDLLEAYERLEPETRERIGLVFVGDGPMRAQLQLQARAIDPGRVHFPGFVHRDDLTAYYALAECFVFPTHSDTWGLAVNEAMACGLPVICSHVAGCAADLVRQNGCLVSAQNISELAATMQRVAADPVLRKQMAAASRRAVSAYSPENCAAGLATAATALEARVA